MTKEEKNDIVQALKQKLNDNSIFYITDISDLNAENTVKLRRLAYQRQISLNVVKNTLLRKAFEEANGEYETLYEVLKGNTSIMFSEVGNAPAKLIQEFRKKNDRPILKGAYIEEAVFIGDNQIDALTQIKSKEELIGDIIMLLQSPAKNVVSALKSSGSTIAGIVKTLSEREA